MFRIDDPSAVNALPAPEAAGTEGYFTEGSPGVQEATLVRASWLNMIQEELRSIIIAAGLTPSKTTYNQLLQALRSTGVFTTPSHFDNSTKGATTEFVQRALGNFSNIAILAAPTVLTSDYAGQYILCGAATTTVTLPHIATLPDGATFWIEAGSAAVNLATQDGTNMVGQSKPAGATSFTLQAGAVVQVVAASSNSTYRLAGGGAPASISGNGYLKDASGRIKQWGIVAAPTNGQVISYPIPFPNAIYTVLASCSDTSGTRVINTGAEGLSNFTLYSATPPAFVYWEATGS